MLLHEDRNTSKISFLYCLSLNGTSNQSKMGLAFYFVFFMCRITILCFQEILNKAQKLFKDTETSSKACNKITSSKACNKITHLKSLRLKRQHQKTNTIKITK